MVRRLQSWALRRPRLPFVLLAAVSVLSLGARVAWLGEPCRSPCRSAADHLLVFDEDYYVNAARAIAGIHPPSGAPYDTTPLGDDGNSEHPQLAKLVIAGSIELFGDGPLAWRLGSVVMGTIAILGMFSLARAAGAGPWVALVAATVMAGDNLMLVHGRIGTLDIYALAAIVWAAALYLRRRPLLAGALVGVGACAKEVAPYVLLVLGLFELLRLLVSRNDIAARSWRLGRCVTAAGGAFIGLLAVLDSIAPPYNPETGKRVPSGPFGHIGHILDYAAHQTSPHGPKGIASYPWQWLGDYKPITYLSVNPARPDGLGQVHPQVHFLGMISPPILVVGLPALLVAAWMVARRPGPYTDLGLLAIAWFAATWVPFELFSLFLDRTSYIYYMLIVMPGVYLAGAYVVARLRPNVGLTAAWVATVLIAAVIMYPFFPVPL
jgi:dolichyl-phosphate-mannose-protein mannosyltransferase